jgi:hypothetical protein
MANTGHDWGAWAFSQLAASDWDADALADDAAAAVSDEIVVDIKSAVRIGVTLTEDNTGAVVANSVTIALLGEVNGSFEAAPGLAGAQVGNPFKFKVTPVQNDSVYVPFSINPTDYHNLKVAVLNESGQELAVSVEIEQADVPVAS